MATAAVVDGERRPTGRRECFVQVRRAGDAVEVGGRILAIVEWERREDGDASLMALKQDSSNNVEALIL